MVQRFILNEVSYFGPGARKELPEVIARLGKKKALIVTDQVMIDLGNCAKLEQALSAQGVEYAIYAEITGEPTGALNSANSVAVLDIMNKLHADGKSILMVTHDMRSAIRGNRILYLKDGVILNEINLGNYDVLQEKQRLDTLKTFLDEMGW